MSKFVNDSFIYKGYEDKLLTSPSGRVLSVSYSGTVSLGGRTYNTLKVPTYRNGHVYRQEWLVEDLQIPLSSLGLSSSHDIDWDNLSSSDKTCTYSWGYYDTSHEYPPVLSRSPAIWPNEIEADYEPGNYPSAAYSMVYNGKRYYNARAVCYLDSQLKNSGWRVPLGKDFLGLENFFAVKNISLGNLYSNMRSHIPEFHGSSWGTTLYHKITYTRNAGGISPGPVKPYEGGGEVIYTPTNPQGSYVDCTYSAERPNEIVVEDVTNGLNKNYSTSRLEKTMSIYVPSGSIDSREATFWPTRERGFIDGKINVSPVRYSTVNFLIGISPLTGSTSHNGTVISIATRTIAPYHPLFYSVRICRAPDGLEAT